MKKKKMIHELRNRIYCSWILDDDDNELSAKILDSEIWETIVLAVAEAIKQIAKEEWMSVEEVIDDILFHNEEE